MASIEISRRVDVTSESKHRLRVWVSKTTNNIPSEIFMFQKLPKIPFFDRTSQFVHIATYSDTLTRPVNSPEEDNPFFRRSSFDLSFNSLAILEEKWIRIKRHVNILIEDIVRLNKLPPAEVKIVDVSPNVPGPGS